MNPLDRRRAVPVGVPGVLALFTLSSLICSCVVSPHPADGEDAEADTRWRLESPSVPEVPPTEAATPGDPAPSATPAKAVDSDDEADEEAEAGEGAEAEGAEAQEPETEEPEEEEAEEAETEEDYGGLDSQESGAKVSGFLSTRYKSRWTGEDEDQDLYGVLGVDLETAGSNPWGVHVLARGAWDMDGETRAEPFLDVEDSYHDSMTGRLYHAYVDAPVEQLEIARAGRQMIYDTPVTAYFDGARLETTEMTGLGWQLGGYAGASSRLFESSASGDFTGGAYTSLRPWRGGKVRFDYMHLEDDTQLGTHQDDLLALGVRHHLGETLQLEGDYSWLEGSSRDMTLRGSWFDLGHGLTARASYYELFQQQGDLSLELNPFYNILRTYFPYRQTRLELTKTLGEWLDCYLGADLRRVDDETDIGQFNRDFDRYHASLVLIDLLPLDSSLSFRGEMWDSPSNDISTWGVDLDSELGGGLRSALGSYYSLYKYYNDIDLEREDVRTYYVELRKPLFDDATDCSVRYEYENSEYDIYHTLRVGMTWRF